MQGIDRLECVYYAAPIPQNMAVVTILGLVFDKIHFPGVYLPKGDYDKKSLKTEILRLEELKDNRLDTQRLIGLLRFLHYRLSLDGICEFPLLKDDCLLRQEGAEQRELVRKIYDAMFPPRVGFEPYFDTNYVKGLPDSSEYIQYPGTLHYPAGALIYAANRNLAIVNDVPGLPMPALDTYKDKVDVLAGLLAIECVKLGLPELPLLTPERLVEFRVANAGTLRNFRSAMLRYAGDLNKQLESGSEEELLRKADALIKSDIVPTLHELRQSLSNKSWLSRVNTGVKLISQIAVSCLSIGDQSRMTTAGATIFNLFASEFAKAGDHREQLKRSGLYYVLKLKAYSS